MLVGMWDCCQALSGFCSTHLSMMSSLPYPGWNTASWSPIAYSSRKPQTYFAAYLHTWGPFPTRHLETRLVASLPAEGSLVPEVLEIISMESHNPLFLGAKYRVHFSSYAIGMSVQCVIFVCMTVEGLLQTHTHPPVQPPHTHELSSVLLVFILYKYNLHNI